MRQGRGLRRNRNSYAYPSLSLSLTLGLPSVTCSPFSFRFPRVILSLLSRSSSLRHLPAPVCFLRMRAALSLSPRRESPQPLRETVRRVSSYGSNGPLSYPAGVEDSAATTSSSTASTSKRRRLAQDRTASPAAGSSLAPPRQVSPNGGGSVSRATLEPDNQPPVSPVVIGFQFSEGDPASRDAVRSALKMREQQQALINQRRGLAAATNKNPSASPQGSPAALAVAGPSSHHQHANGRSPHPANAHTLPSINSILTPKSASPIIIASPASGAPPAELTSADPLSRHPNELPQLEQEPPTPPLGSAGIGGFAEGGLARRRTDGGRSKAATLSIRTSGGAGSSDGAKVGCMPSLFLTSRIGCLLRFPLIFRAPPCNQRARWTRP